MTWAAFGLVLTLYGIPGMIDDWEFWQQLFSDWKWHNLIMVTLGLGAIFYGLSPLIIKFKKGTIRAKWFSSVLNYKIEENTTVMEILLIIILTPPVIVVITVVMGLAVGVFVGSLALGVWVLKWIWDLLGAGRMSRN